jgi:hypothetical protein
MKSFCLLILWLILSHFSFAQKLTIGCNCPLPYSGGKVDTTFKLSSGYSISLCGSRETEYIKEKTLYEGFVLFECGIDTAIKFWGEVTICDLAVLKDTLFVKTVVSLPVGNNMAAENIYWEIERIYPKDGRMTRDSTVNRFVPRYTASQIVTVLKLYDNTPDQNSEKTADLMDKLLIATISGSEKAKNYLKNFHKKFTLLDGAIFEQYDDDIRMLEEWEKR